MTSLTVGHLFSAPPSSRGPMAWRRCQTLKRLSAFGKFLGVIIDQGFGVQQQSFFSQTKSQKESTLYSVCCAGLCGTFLGAKPEAKVLADVPNDDSSELNCLDQLIFWFWDII